MKHILRILLLGLIVLLTFAALFSSWLSYSGRKDLAKTKADLLARGEKLTLIELAPPPVPDEENTFSGPFWNRGPNGTPFLQVDTSISKDELDLLQSQFPWKNSSFEIKHRSAIANRLAQPEQDLDTPSAEAILSLLSPLKPALAELPALLDRPGAHSHIEYQSLFPFTDPFDPYPGLDNISRALSARASVSLALGNPSQAAEDISTLFRLADKLLPDPLLYCQMLRCGIIFRAVSPLRAGLSQHAWSGSELQTFQNTLEQIDTLSPLAVAFRGERGLFNQVIESFQTQPSQESIISSGKLLSPLSGLVGTLYLSTLAPGDQAARNRYTQQIIDALEQSALSGKPFKNPIDFKNLPGKYRTPLTYTMLYLLAGNLDVAAVQQNEIRGLVIVCALERYRLQHNRYPKSLSDLVPTYLSSIPSAIRTRSSPGYQRSDAGFLLQMDDNEIWP